MKQIRVKKEVVLDAQTYNKGIVLVRMEELKFMGSLSIAQVGYYQQVLDENAIVGQPKYKLLPIPVKDAVLGKSNVKRVPLTQPVLDGIFSQIGINILASSSFVTQFSSVLTYAALFQMVIDENYRKLNPDGTCSVMTADDWEIVEQQELVTA